MLQIKKISVILLLLFICGSCTKNSNKTAKLQDTEEGENLTLNKTNNENILIFDPLGQITVLSNKTEKGFLNMYVLQTEENFPLETKKVNGEVHFHKDFLKIKGSGKNYLLALHKTSKGKYGKNVDETIIGYGIANHKSIFKMVPENERKGKKNAKEMIINTLVDDSKTLAQKGSESDCTSGGEGSSGCSIDESAIVADVGCSVDCDPGYYACCDSGDVTCTCIEG